MRPPDGGALGSPVRNFFALFFLSAIAAVPQTSAPLRYTLRFPAPQSHYVEVEAEIPSAGEAEVELMMAVWTPGSYLVRDYSGHVERVRAKRVSGAPLAVTKTRKNRWRVETGGAARFFLQYSVYCRQMTVRTNWVGAEFALLNGAPTFITRADAGTGAAPRAHLVAVELPPGWESSHSGLDAGAGPHRYAAEDFETLVDSPILAGDFQVREFAAAGKPHFLVDAGSLGAWDGGRAARDARKIVETFQRMWGAAPYERYTFFNLIGGGWGGLEHRNSSVLMTARRPASNRAAHLKWLSLVSHEYFHVWNVKRLRPRALGPFDFERETHTRDLWIAEGVTSYYDDLGVRRAGLSTDEEYIERLSEQIETLQTTPGRLAQSLSESSFDAWIKFYKPNENSKNSQVSYYNKGTLAAFLLDMRIREASGGEKSLDDAMRLAYARFSGDEGYRSEDFRRTVSEVAGEDLSAWFRRVVDSTEELEYAAALRWLGLRFKRAAAADGEEAAAWLGVKTEVRGSGRLLLVAEVLRETPAFEAGIDVGDEIVAIDGYRVLPGELGGQLEHYRPGEAAEFLVARRGEMMTIAVTFGGKPPDKWKLEVDPDADAEAEARRKAWLDPYAAP